MTVLAYKLDPAFLDAKMKEYTAQLGSTPALPVFVEQTRKVLAADRMNYLRYGPYWWAVKRVLRDEGLDIGEYDDEAWANEYSQKTGEGEVDPARTLLAAWEFGDANIGQHGISTREYDIDGIAFVLYDPDQEER
ncbi:hypothetical protein LGM46_29170 [Burkholderia arboris]|uniref:hypothetical protein n=1 Tax=Burkholderia arboris TaxID=488730 RepID=UPI001CF26C1A|nr:hypothetical protein [Burkholderia arboris]MCA8037043.1 hypothetical protein [Burkholderia arboris]